MILAFSIFSGDVQVLTPSRKDLHEHNAYFTGVSTDTGADPGYFAGGSTTALVS